MTMGCDGFVFAGVASGLKKRGGKDLGLILAETPASAAAVFTRNRVQAAPVHLSRERIRSGCCRAVIANSGSANCCTGDAGRKAAQRAAALAAGALGIPEEQVLTASTGVIGLPLEVSRIEAAMPALTAALHPGGIEDFAAAIMTTDTRPKIASAGGTVGGKDFKVLGCAKGAGMIRPAMATLLAFPVPDAAMAPGLLREALATAVDRSFNRITVDGHTSTTDTVILMAGGRSGVKVETPEGCEVFQKALDEVTGALARKIVGDGEGATKLVEVRVAGAPSDAGARAVADAVANSSLVKTALFGQDANWGRVLAAAGRAGVPFEPEKADLYFDEVRMVAGGAGSGPEAEARATEVLKRREFTLTLDLHAVAGSASVLTCDFSIDYVKINADYRS